MRTTRHHDGTRALWQLVILSCVQINAILWLGANPSVISGYLNERLIFVCIIIPAMTNFLTRGSIWERRDQI